jgi:hypothetical protein
MGFANFFEQVGETQAVTFRCKGCGAEVKQWNREEHFGDHKRDRGMFLEASRIAANLARETGTGDTRTDVCVNCGEHLLRSASVAGRGNNATIVCYR